MGETGDVDGVGSAVDQLGPWRAGIPAKIKAGGEKAAYWKLALRLGRLPTIVEERGWGDGEWDQT